MSSREGEVWHDSLLKHLTRKQVSADLKARSHFWCWQQRLMHISKSPTSPMLVKFPALFPSSKVTSSVVFPAIQTGARCFRCFFPVSDEKIQNVLLFENCSFYYFPSWDEKWFDINQFRIIFMGITLVSSHSIPLKSIKYEFSILICIHI